MSLTDFDCICGRHLLDGDKACKFCGTSVEKSLEFLQKEINQERLSLQISSLTNEIIRARREYLKNRATLQKIGELEELEGRHSALESQIEGEKYYVQKMNQWRNREKSLFGTIKAAVGVMQANILYILN